MNVFDAEKLEEVRKAGRSTFRILPNGKIGLRDLADTCYVAQFESLDELGREMIGVPKKTMNVSAPHFCTREPCPKCDEGTYPAAGRAEGEGGGRKANAIAGERYRELRRLLGEASPRPWVWNESGDRIECQERPQRLNWVAFGGPVGWENSNLCIDPEDIRLIVAAVNALPELLDRLDTLEKACEEDPRKRANADVIMAQVRRIQELEQTARKAVVQLRKFEHDAVPGLKDALRELESALADGRGENEP